MNEAKCRLTEVECHSCGKPVTVTVYTAENNDYVMHAYCQQIMPGPIDIDPNTIRPKDDIAYQDANGNWRAGPDAKGYSQGQFVDADYAKRARGVRQRTNLTKSLMRAQNVDEATARSEAETLLNRLQGVDDEDERGRIWREIAS